MTRYYGDLPRMFTTKQPLDDLRSTSVYEGAARSAEECVKAAGEYGQWSLWKSTVFRGMYTARHPAHGEVWIDAMHDGAALAEFRRVVRGYGGRT